MQKTQQTLTIRKTRPYTNTDLRTSITCRKQNVKIILKN